MLLTLNDPFHFMEQVFNPFPNYETDDAGNAFHINMDLPGVKKEDLKLEVNGRKLQISATRKGGRQGEFRKVFDLPSTIDPEQIKASLQDGVLNVELPKVAQAKPRLIKID